MIALNPKILTWARETAGLDFEAAARKIGLNAARGVSGADRLAALEAGEGVASSAILRRMSQQYHRPLLTFYLPEQPVPAELGEDFRTLPEKGDPSNVLLAALLRDVKARQCLVREIIEDDDDPTEIGLVGSQQGTVDAHQLSLALINSINFSRVEYRSKGSVEEAFVYLRSCVERAGVFVLLAGDCGSWQTAIDVRIFRGFAIADSLAPFIVINDQDAKSAWSFTLLHELAHLLLGETGVSGSSNTAGIEQLCNDTAAATLVAAEEIAALVIDGPQGDQAAITVLANEAKISRSMVAYQLYRANRITFDRWDELRTEFRVAWLEQKATNRAKNRERAGGVNWYVVRRHRLGAALLSVARRGMDDGSLTPTKAARMLGVKPMSVYPLLANPARRGEAG